MDVLPGSTFRELGRDMVLPAEDPFGGEKTLHPDGAPRVNSGSADSDLGAYKYENHKWFP